MEKGLERVMARPLRLEFAGALYHVTSRGNRQESIYEADVDREHFLGVLSAVCDRYNWICHAYCLMTNHYHLLIETPDSNLSKGMRQLNGVYTQTFNRQHSRVGHVFQGRYKAILVDKNDYFLELARYIVLNPVRASMVRAAKDWPWSSYRATAGQVEPPAWLQVDGVLAAFGKRRAKAIEAYRAFVSEGKGQPSPWNSLKNQMYLGDDKFVERMLNHLDKDHELTEIPSTQRRAMPNTLAEFEAGASERDEAIIKAVTNGGYSLKEVGDHFGL